VSGVTDPILGSVIVTGWSQQKVLVQSDGAANDFFGRSVNLSSNGNIAIVTAMYDDIGPNTNQGSATVYR
jgi:hypothetical protein